MLFEWILSLESTTASWEVTFRWFLQPEWTQRAIRRTALTGLLRDVHGGEVVKTGQSKKIERLGQRLEE